MNLDPFLTLYINELKLVIDLSVRSETIELLEENIGVNLHDLGLGSGFFFFYIAVKTDSDFSLGTAFKISNKRKKSLNQTSSKFRTLFQITPSGK